MSSFYRNNYYNQKTDPKKLEYQKILTLENEISNLKNKFGESLIKPKPEDFQLNETLINEIIKINEKAEKYNKTKGKILLIFSLILFCLILYSIYSIFEEANIIFSLFLSYIFAEILSEILSEIFPDLKRHNLNNKYTQYLKLLEEYPSEIEVQKIKEKDRFLKERRGKVEYWFSLNGHDFETEITNLFNKSGLFNAQKTKGSGDGGVDIILKTKNGITIFVECKAHKHPVGPNIIRGLYGTMASQKVKRGILISLGGVTEGVMDFIKDKYLSVVDVNDIIKFNEWVSNYNDSIISRDLN